MSVALTSAVSWLWISKTNQDYILKQNEIRQQSQQQYQQLNNLFRARLESWIELLVQMHPDGEDKIALMSQTLSEKLEFLRLNWQIENVWLTDTDGNNAFSTTESPADYILALQQRAIEEQRSIESVVCDSKCKQVLSVPILGANGELATVSLSISLLETMAFLNQSTGALVAQVIAQDTDSQQYIRDLTLRGQVARKTEDTVEALIAQFPIHSKVNDVVENGIQVRANERDYLVNLIDMTPTDDSSFILLAHDITPMTMAHQEYQKTVMYTMVGIILIMASVFYLLLNNIRKRLLNLSDQLPLLAQRDYETFRQIDAYRARWVKDELDTLQGTVIEVANQLERLDTKVQEKTHELEKIAMYDTLTSLPNRNMLTFQLAKAIESLGRDDGFVVILFFDLDDFKKVNDSYGHGVGDALLIEASNRLKDVVRTTDIACRFGGDEFVVLLNHVKKLDGALMVADKLLETIREPINIDNLRFYVSTSIGIAVTDSNEMKTEDLIRHADIAMYQAKTAGGNCFRLYDSEMSQRALDKVELESEARDALLDNQFFYALQPQIDIQTNKLIGFEALIRWNHPERGFVSPGQFIPVLENTAFMLSLGYWCIDHAFELLQEFHRRGYKDLKIAVNLSGAQFLDPELVPLLESRLKTTGIPAHLIELELTERTLVSDIENATLIMQRLIDLGYIISIDDFGTGYSSLSYLKRMPAHIIKIDRVFIDGMMKSNADKQIVASTISMVRNLGMKVVAEGIEEPEQLDVLHSLQCDWGQGYYIARPISEYQLFAAMSEHYKDGKWHIEPLNSINQPHAM